MMAESFVYREASSSGRATYGLSSLQPIGFLPSTSSLGLMQAYRAPFMEPFLQIHQRRRARRCRRLAGVRVAFCARRAALRRCRDGRCPYTWAVGRGPWLPAPVWMLVKTFGLMALMLGLGRLVKPLSTAQMLKLSWRVLIPVGLVNVLLVGGLILLGVGPA